MVLLTRWLLWVLSATAFLGAVSGTIECVVCNDCEMYRPGVTVVLLATGCTKCQKSHYYATNKVNRRCVTAETEIQLWHLNIDTSFHCENITLLGDAGDAVFTCFCDSDRCNPASKHVLSSVVNFSVILMWTFLLR